MTKKFQLYITNNSGNPLKIPFKRGTPRELQAKVDGVIPVGKKAIVPSSISEFVDMVIVENFARRSLVKYKKREVSAIPSKTKPVKKAKKAAKSKVEVKVEKKNERRGVINA